MNRARPKSMHFAHWRPPMTCLYRGLTLLLAAALSTLCARSEEPADGGAIVIDLDGKEHKLGNLKFTTGTRRLAWLADPTGKTEDARKGPLALEVRESTSAMPLAQGIVTFVPVVSLESAKYDFEKELVTLSVKGLTQPLTGALFYPRVNVLGLSGTSDGKAATFTGGVRGKGSIKSVAFGGAQGPPRLKGSTWKIQIVKTKKDEPVADDILLARNLKVLVSFPGGSEQVLDSIPIRKGPAIPLNESLKRFELLANDLNTNVAAAEVEAGTAPERVVAIPLTFEQDKKTGTILGILGEVDAGWKLFPLHTVKVIKPSARKIE
jgi:hypothetical protein